MRKFAVVAVTAIATAILASAVWMALRESIDPYVVSHDTARLEIRQPQKAGSLPTSRPAAPADHEGIQSPALPTPPLPLTTRIGEIPDDLRDKALTLPVQGTKAEQLHPAFYDNRGQRGHEAIDIMAPRGQPVLAVEDGMIVKLFDSVRGGLTIYQFDPSAKYAYYYAHLDRYANEVLECKMVKRGEVIGYVGSTGNANPANPHLHFAIFLLGPEKLWWKGEALDPYPALVRP